MTFTPTYALSTIYNPIASVGPDIAKALSYHGEVETFINQLDARIDGTGLVATGGTAVGGIPPYTTNLGNGARPTPLYTPAAPLLTGIGTTALGAGVLDSAANNSTFCTFAGYEAGGNGANNLYCNEGYGLRNQYVLVDGEYVATYGTDSAFTMTYGRNIAAYGSKTLLWTVDARSSTVLGTSAGYGLWKVEDSVVIGESACDAGQPASAAAAATLAQICKGNVVVGKLAARTLRSENNVFIGNNAGSFTTITGGFNLGIGRSSFGALTSGIGNVGIGDGAGGITATGNYNSYLGFSVSAPSGGAAYSNTTSLGYQSGDALTGSNQVQLGGSGTVPYAFASLSIRSDKRDKIDAEFIDVETAEAIVLGANWLTYRVDPREGYIDTVETVEEVVSWRDEDQPTGLFDAKGQPIIKKNRVEVREKIPKFVTVERERDGSRAGKRRHAGVFAQDEAERLKSLGIDFAGIKHGEADGQGRDVWSLQYEQYIPHMGAVLQAQASRLAALADENAMLRDSLASVMTRLAALEKAA
jgi:hypothetical protein